MMRTTGWFWFARASMLVAIAGANIARADEEASLAARPKIAEVRVGFDGTCKVGCWTPVWVAVSDNISDSILTIAVTTPDSDGVNATVTVALSSGASNDAPSQTALLYAKLGTIGGSIHIELLASDKSVLDRRELSPLSSNKSGTSDFMPLVATSELILQLGSGLLGLTEAFPDRDEADDTLARRVVALDGLDELPTEWYGYESVDVIVIAGGDLNFCQRLADDTRRFAALRRWLELGGRLVVVGARNARELFATPGPFADLIPGKFEETVRLPETRALENFSDTNAPIGSGGGRSEISVPRLSHVTGRVELSGRGDDLPLIVYDAKGFGELTFIGLDLDSAPIAGWEGRSSLLRAAMKSSVAVDDVETSRRTLVSRGYSDLSGALRQRIGKTFAGVTAVGFPLVAGLIILYLLLLGPVDYLLIHKLARRPWMAWLTFPILVLASCAAAIWGLDWSKRDADRCVNRIELVDMDVARSAARGTCWATVYSADARRFDVSLAPRWPDGRAVNGAEQLMSWLGSPGSGLGGMHVSGARPDVIGTSYHWSTQLDELIGLPILTSSTKSLLARWHAPMSEIFIVAELKTNEDGLLVGTLESVVPLRDACLLYGAWGYRLGDLKAHERREIGPRLDALQVRTLLASRARAPATGGLGPTAQEGFLADRATSSELLEVMMFYDAVGGYSFAGLLNRYQSYCDLSRLLALDRAILVGWGDGGGSDLVDPSSGNSFSTAGDVAAVAYRFILPVQN